MVNQFWGRYFFLSNFSHSEILINGITYPTVEHAFQAQKTTNEAERLAIASLATPNEAKRYGNRVKLRSNWNELRLQVMHDCLVQKFQQEDLKEKLIATYPEELVEGNTWGDSFWGVCYGKGENHLGKLLMQIRQDLMNGEL